MQKIKNMENFDLKESWLVKIKENIDSQNEKIGSKDIKFFNLSILLDLARLSQKLSYNCDTCKSNKDILWNLSITSAEKINTYNGRKEIVSDLDIVSKHLRKEHKYFVKNYHLAIFTLIGILIGAFIGFLAGFIIKQFQFTILVGSALGLFVGRTIGSIKEKKLYSNGQIY